MLQPADHELGAGEFEGHRQTPVLGQCALTGGDGAGEVTVCGEQQRPAARTDSQHPRTVQTNPVVLQGLDESFGVVQAPDADQRLRGVRQERRRDELRGRRHRRPPLDRRAEQVHGGPVVAE